MDGFLQLSVEIHGHEGDVRCCCSLPGGNICSGSRDGTLRTWRRKVTTVEHDTLSGMPSEVETTIEYEQVSLLHGHDGKFVTAVIFVPPDRCGEMGPMESVLEGCIVSGGQDGTAKIWNASLDNNNGAHIQSLEGHGQLISAVCSTPSGLIVTGSWDKTARVWRGSHCINTLIGHEHAIWSVLALNDLDIFTGSADHSIRKWHNGQCTSVMQGHTDAVRCLVNASFGLLSCGNDSQLRLWDHSTNEVMQSWADPSGAFIYDLALLPSDRVASCGEDRTVKVWTGHDIRQELLHPRTVWGIDVLTIPNSDSFTDIVTACEDGVVRVFSDNPAHIAPEDVRQKYEQHLAAQSRPSGQAGGMDLTKLPGIEALQGEGGECDRDGQTRIVKEEGTAFAYTWSAMKKEWVKMGEVVDGPGGGGGGLTEMSDEGRPMIDGIAYDFVWDVDVDEARKLQLGYNRGEDPYVRAQQFIDENEVQQDHWQQIAEFIIQQYPDALNAPGPTLRDPLTGGAAYVPGRPTQTPGSVTGVDPLTGGGRYVPSARSQAPTRGGGIDPFTGGGAYRPSNNQQQAQEPNPFLENTGRYIPPGSEQSGVSSKRARTEYFPRTTMMLFDTAKHSAMYGKIAQLNTTLIDEEHGNALNTSELGVVENLLNTLETSKRYPNADEAMSIIQKMLGWPLESVFPAVDLLRLWVLTDGAQCVSKDNVLLSIGGLAYSDAAEKSKPAPINALRMVFIRLVANCFKETDARTYLMKHTGEVLDFCLRASDSTHSATLTSASTALLNFSIALKGSDFDLGVPCVNSLMRLLKNEKAESEAIFRSLAALGTLIVENSELLQFAQTLEYKLVLESAAQRLNPSHESSTKAKQCIKDLLDLC